MLSSLCDPPTILPHSVFLPLTRFAASIGTPSDKRRAEEVKSHREEIAKFVKHLKHATIKDQVLELPENIYFWGNGSKYGRKLFVRSCYDEYFRLHFEAVANSGKKICVYTGSPGIGKSMFSIYVLWRLIATNEAIAASHLEAVGDSAAAAASANSDTTFDLVDLESATDKKIKDWRENQTVFACFIKFHTKAWYIRRDGNVTQGNDTIPQDIVFWDVPEKVPIPTDDVRGFSFASPALSRLNEPGKHANSHVLTMPPWSLDELQRLRTACFPQTTADEVETRFRMVGGKPRYIFQKIKTQEDIMTAINSVQDYQKALDFIDAGLHADDELKSLLTVVLPRDDPGKCTLSWASELIADSIYRRFVDSVRRDLRNFVLLGGGIAPIAVARGWTFERLVHDCLPLGNSSELEALPFNPHGPPNVLPALPQVQSKTFKSLREFQVVPPESDVFYFPEFSNLCAVDCFIMHGDVLFACQVTVSEKHKIKVHGLEQIWKMFRNGNGNAPSQMRLVFVLPNSQDARERFTTKQEFTTVAGRPLTRRPALLEHVTQWRCFVPRAPHNM